MKNYRLNLGILIAYIGPKVCVEGIKANHGVSVMYNRVIRSLIVFVFLLSSCAGGVGSLLSDVLTGNTGSGDDIGEASSGESSSGSNATDSSSESSGSSSSSDDSGDGSSESSGDSNDTNAISAIELPGIPSLMADDTFAYASDSESEIPITGSSSDAIGSTVVVSTSSELATLVTTPSGLFGSLTRKYIIKDARAATADEICAQDGVECCTPDDQGTYSCFLNSTDSSVSKVYVSLMDSSGNLGTATEISIASNFHYLGETPQDVVIAGDDIYTITNGVAVKTSYNSENERFEVAGSHEENYADFTTDGSRISYGSSDSLVGVMGESGIQLLSVADGTATDTGEVGCEATSDESPSVMKSLNGIIYCGKTTVATDEASLEYAVTLDAYRPTSHKNIQILAPEDGLTHVQTLGFDSGTIGSFNWTVAAFSDGDNVRIVAIRKYGADYSYDERIGGDVWKSVSDISIKDIIFYHGDESGYSRFAILDSQNDKVWLGKVNVDSGEFDMDDDNVVAVGDNPVTMKLHNNKLYVLNVGGQSVSVIRLFNADGSTPRRISRVSATLDLTTLISGRSLSFTPTSLAISDGKLIIADQTKKALVVVDTDDITEESIDDESSESTETSSETSTETETETSTETESTSETETTTETSTSSSTETSTTTDTSSSSSTDTGSSTSTSSSSTSSSSTSTSTSTSTDGGSGRGGRR